MQAPEHAPPRSAAEVGSHDDGLPWVRLITGLAALAMLAVPVGRHVAGSGTQPIAARVVTAQALPPAQPLPRPVLPSRETEDGSVDAAPSAAPASPSTTEAGPVAAGLSDRVARAATVPAHHLRRVATTSRRAGAYRQFARTARGLTRAQVVREYLASREQVAALTGEDSGSVWLTRTRTKQRAMRVHALFGKRQHVAAGCAPTRA